MKNISKYHKANIVIIIFCCLLSFSGCKKFIMVDPPVTSVNQGNVYREDATAASVLTAMYARMANTGFSLNMTVYPELAADNLALFTLNKQDFTAYYINNIQPSDPQSIVKFWFTIYPLVFNANTAIEGLEGSTSLNESVKRNLLGEAYFLRAFYYFYLVNLYGQVPLATTTDYTVNNTLTRSGEDQVYGQIIMDLKQAQSMLTDAYLQADARTSYSANEERVRPNRSAATALLARAYLYHKEWANAEQAASEVIAKSKQYSLIALDQVFLKNSKETIWALQTVRSNESTREGELFTLRTGGPNNSGQPIYLSDSFDKSFQIGDQRKVKWTGTQTDGTKIYPYSSKYKAVLGPSVATEYAIVLRLGEQYLIRSEARIQQNKIADGIADLNVLRDRAIDKSESDENKRLKLLSTSLSKEEAMTALLYERRMELFCEWGHRWFDLKRMGLLDDVMKVASPKKGGDWKPFEALLPVPAEERLINSNLSQNPGYPN